MKPLIYAFIWLAVAGADVGTERAPPDLKNHIKCVVLQNGLAIITIGKHEYLYRVETLPDGINTVDIGEVIVHKEPLLYRLIGTKDWYSFVKKTFINKE